MTALSAWRLELDAVAFWLSLGAVGAGTAALCGLAVGLGALYANFEEDNPARIVSGLGGTLNFLLSLGHIVLVALGLAVVLLRNPLLLEGLLAADGRWLVIAAALWIGGTSALAGFLPMRLGLRHLDRVDF